MKGHDCIMIFGSSGTGKSYLTLYLIEQMCELKKYTIVIDIKAEYTGLTKLGFKRSFWTPELVKKLTIDSAIKIILSNPRLLVEPYQLSFAEEVHLIDTLAGACLALGNCLFVMEESLDYASGILDETQRNLQMLIRRGRSFGCDTIVVFQRLGNISKIILSQGNIFISFRVSEVNDLARITYIFEKPKEEIANLPPRHYFYRDMRIPKTKLLTTTGLSLRTKHGG